MRVHALIIINAELVREFLQSTVLQFYRSTVQSTVPQCSLRFYSAVYSSTVESLQTCRLVGLSIRPSYTSVYVARAFCTIAADLRAKHMQNLRKLSNLSAFAVLLKEFSVESHIIVCFFTFLSCIGV